MRKLLLLLGALSFWACSSSKKTHEASTTKASSVVQQTVRNVKSERFTDTTTTTKGRLSITEVEFFTPDSPANTIESLSIKADGIDIAGIKGKPIRSIRQQTFELLRDKKGEDIERQEDKEEELNISIQKEHSTLIKQSQSKPLANKRSLCYLSLILLIIFVLILSLKGQSLVGWLQKWIFRVRDKS